MLKHRSDFFVAVLFVLFCELVGIMGSVFTMSSVTTWYTTLLKPELNPPAWVFGPVWMVLYALMGLAAFLVWRRGRALNSV